MGRRVIMTEDALANYGEQWRGVVLEVTHSANKHMPAEEFYRRNEPEGYHPGYDGSSGSVLYDLKRVDTGEGLPMSLYGWEVRSALTRRAAPKSEPEASPGPRP